MTIVLTLMRQLT